MIESTGCHTTKGGTIETSAGLKFDVLNPDPAQVLIADIVGGLSKLCRFGGQCREFYSVAEHCVHCHDMAVEIHGEGDLAFAVLMHDAAEAYVGDMVRPLKVRDDFYRSVEDGVQAAIRSAFAIPWDDATAAEVRRLDNIACRAEAHQLMETRGVNWMWGETPLRMLPIQPWGPKAAATMFGERFRIYR